MLGQLQDARAAHGVDHVEDQGHLAEGEDAADEAGGGRVLVAVDEGRDAIGEEGVAVLVGEDVVWPKEVENEKPETSLLFTRPLSSARPSSKARR